MGWPFSALVCQRRARSFCVVDGALRHGASYGADHCYPYPGSRHSTIRCPGVFLLTGVGSLLGVLVNRLGRIVDRYRQLRSLPAEQITPHRAEMALLQRRSRLIHFAIRYSTLCALLGFLVW